MNKPNCYECKHRRNLVGDCHSSCAHPDSGYGNNPLDSLLALMGKRVHNLNPLGEKLGIAGNLHGIKHGWFCWPWNYDPIWLETCNGFEAKGGESSETTVPSVSESASGEVPVRNANEASGCIE